jgi:hypothetical protein
MHSWYESCSFAATLCVAVVSVVLAELLCNEFTHDSPPHESATLWHGMAGLAPPGSHMGAGSGPKKLHSPTCWKPRTTPRLLGHEQDSPVCADPRQLHAALLTSDSSGDSVNKTIHTKAGMSKRNSSSTAHMYVSNLVQRTEALQEHPGGCHKG